MIMPYREKALILVLLEINVKGNTVSIVDGDATPSLQIILTLEMRIPAAEM